MRSVGIIESSIPIFTSSNSSVTGGCGSLGIEAARALLEHGASGVSLFDVDLAQAQDIVDRMRSDFPSATIITKKVDVRNQQVVQAAVAETADELGSLDILLCFAGVVACNHALDVALEEWKRTLDINTTGSWLCAQAVAE